MSLERRPQLKGLRAAREIIKAEQIPVLAALFGNCKFVARDVKWCAFPAIGRLDLDQPDAPVRGEAGNIIACAVAVFVGNLLPALKPVISC